MKTDHGDKYSKTWCVLPWIHTASLTDGSTQLCCVAESVSDTNLNQSTVNDYWSSSYLKETRKKMLQGEKVKACRRCYEEEANGYKSHRIIENKTWFEKLGAEQIDQLVDQSKTNPDNLGIVSLDLRLGNTCNLQCIMCQPRESSKWVQLADKLVGATGDLQLKGEWVWKNQIKFESYEWYKNETFWKDLKDILPSVRELIIAGGEPMLIKQHLRFIAECAASGEAGHIHLRYHTNMMELPIEMLPHWEKFEKVEFFVSTDGMDDIANYIRYPSKWNKIIENIKIIDQMPSNISLRFLYSVQALNIAHLPDFIDWTLAQGFKKQNEYETTQAYIHPGLVHWPQYLNPKILPEKMKYEITEKYKALKNRISGPADKYDGVVSFMNSEDWSSKLHTCFNYLEALDKVRGTSYKNVFPEFSKISFK